MTLTKLSPAEAKAKISQGAKLIDIRSADEHARSRIPGAQNVPLGHDLNLGDAPAVIFHCRSGMRTDANAAQLAANSPCQAYLLEGGWTHGERLACPSLPTRERRLKSCGRSRLLLAFWC